MTNSRGIGLGAEGEDWGAFPFVVDVVVDVVVAAVEVGAGGCGWVVAAEGLAAVGDKISLHRDERF